MIRISALVLLTLSMTLAGCPDDTCRGNGECLNGYSCTKDGRCIKTDPLRIETASLPGGVTGEEYQAELIALGGIKPYRWSADTDLLWLSIEEEAGGLVGTPDYTISDAKVIVSVTDNSYGEGFTVSEEFRFDISYCNNMQFHPCSDRGLCDDVGSCICDDGYTGEQCEKCAAGFHEESGNCIQNQLCLDNTCSSHGTCDDSTGVVICTCDLGYEGEFCDWCSDEYHREGDKCTENEKCPVVNSCSGHGTCDDSTGVVSCACDQGYAGDLCENCAGGYHEEHGNCVEDTQCVIDSCSGHGFCDDSTGMVVCTCEKGYTGDHCEQCDTGYLGSGGLCVPIVLGGFADINAGTFTMGSPSDEAGRQQDEMQHEVTLTNNFEIMVNELTQADFTALIGWNPSQFGPNGGGLDCGVGCPVENVSWYDTVAFANQLSLLAGATPCYIISSVSCYFGGSVGSDYMLCFDDARNGIYSATVGLNGVTSVYQCEGYRLPTEAEWEYAARAGAVEATYNGDLDEHHLSCEQPNSVLDPIAWFCGNSETITHEVGTKGANQWGLYDMLGNVTERVWDWYGLYETGPVINPEGPTAGTKRVARGDTFVSTANKCRLAYRSETSPGSSMYGGIRLVRTID